jgi:hypothetical protein
MDDLLGEKLKYKSPSGQVYSVEKYYKSHLTGKGIHHYGLKGKETIFEVDIIKSLRKFTVYE